MILFLMYYMAGMMVFLLYLTFSKKTQAAFRTSLNTYEEQALLAIKVWTYPVIWPIDVAYDLFKYFAKKVPLEDL